MNEELSLIDKRKALRASIKMLRESADIYLDLLPEEIEEKDVEDVRSMTEEYMKDVNKVLILLREVQTIILAKDMK